MRHRTAIAAALCVLWTSGPAAASEPCDGAEATLEVATLNTWGLPAPLSSQRRTRFGKIADFVDSGFDIVGLQEVWNSARSLLLHDVRVPTASHDSGLAVVTRHASTRPTLHRYSEARGVDRLKSKGVLTTRVDVPGGEPTWVVVTHMQAGGTEKASAVRASQVRQLLGVVERLEGPAIVMGDFNLYDDLHDDRASGRRMDAAGWTDARSAGADQGTYPGIDDRLDRIYVRDGSDASTRVLAADTGRARGLSDHRPVQATVALCTAR